MIDLIGFAIIIGVVAFAFYFTYKFALFIHYLVDRMANPQKYAERRAEADYLYEQRMRNLNSLIDDDVDDDLSFGDELERETGFDDDDVDGAEFDVDFDEDFGSKPKPKPKPKRGRKAATK